MADPVHILRRPNGKGGFRITATAGPLSDAERLDEKNGFLKKFRAPDDLAAAFIANQISFDTLVIRMRHLWNDPAVEAAAKLADRDLLAMAESGQDVNWTVIGPECARRLGPLVASAEARARDMLAPPPKQARVQRARRSAKPRAAKAKPAPKRKPAKRPGRGKR